MGSTARCGNSRRAAFNPAIRIFLADDNQTRREAIAAAISERLDPSLLNSHDTLLLAMADRDGMEPGHTLVIVSASQNTGPTPAGAAAIVYTDAVQCQLTLPVKNGDKFTVSTSSHGWELRLAALAAQILTNMSTRIWLLQTQDERYPQIEEVLLNLYFDVQHHNFEDLDSRPIPAARHGGPHVVAMPAKLFLSQSQTDASRPPTDSHEAAAIALMPEHNPVLAEAVLAMGASDVLFETMGPHEITCRLASSIAAPRVVSALAGSSIDRGSGLATRERFFFEAEDHLRHSQSPGHAKALALLDIQPAQPVRPSWTHELEQMLAKHIGVLIQAHFAGDLTVKLQSLQFAIFATRSGLILKREMDDFIRTIQVSPLDFRDHSELGLICHFGVAEHELGMTIDDLICAADRLRSDAHTDLASTQQLQQGGA